MSKSTVAGFKFQVWSLNGKGLPGNLRQAAGGQFQALFNLTSLFQLLKNVGGRRPLRGLEL
jgi:hypothetical protein